MKPGDLVSCTTFSEELLGIVLDIHPMEGIWKDTGCSEPMYTVTVLFNEVVPKYIGIGRIGVVTDSVLRVVK